MKRVCEFFWPILEDWPPEVAEEIRQSECDDLAAIQSTSWTNHPELAVEEARRLADSEEDRRRTAEGKATTFILFAGALIPLLTYLETSVWDGKVGTAPKWLIIPILLVAVLYLVTAVVWAFKAISVGSFHRVDVRDLTKAWQSADPQTELIRSALIATRRSRDAINEKVSSIKMSLAFMMRAFIAFGLLIIVEGAWEIAHTLPFGFRLTLEKAAPAVQPPQPSASATPPSQTPIRGLFCDPMWAGGRPAPDTAWWWLRPAASPQIAQSFLVRCHTLTVP